VKRQSRDQGDLTGGTGKITIQLVPFWASSVMKFRAGSLRR
jgi:hypothetical protein